MLSDIEISQAAHIKQISEIAERQIRKYTELGYDKLPICIAKTHLSLSQDPNLKGAPRGFRVPVHKIHASIGACFFVSILM